MTLHMFIVDSWMSPAAFRQSVNISVAFWTTSVRPPPHMTSVHTGSGVTTSNKSCCLLSRYHFNVVQIFCRTNRRLSRADATLWLCEVLVCSVVEQARKGTNNCFTQHARICFWEISKFYWGNSDSVITSLPLANSRTHKINVLDANAQWEFTLKLITLSSELCNVGPHCNVM